MNNKTKCPKCHSDQYNSAKMYPGKMWFTCYMYLGGCGKRWTVYRD